MKSIMYHYVRESDPKYPYFRFLDIKNFKKQLDYFENRFGFIRKNQWETIIKNKSLKGFDEKIILTFDDSLKCHIDYVLPELERRGLWAIFYIPTLPYMKKKLLDVHKIHLLCGSFKGSEIYAVLKNLIKEDMIVDKKRKEFRNETYNSQKNYKEITNIKRILNYFIDYKFREEVIDKIFKELNFQYDYMDFYMAIEDLKKIKKAGNIIGSHSISHPVMSKLTREKQYLEIKDSFDFLENNECINVRTYCHPYGGFHSFNKDTKDLLEIENIEYSFNVEPRDISTNDILNFKHCLPRYDCNLFPYGEAS